MDRELPEKQPSNLADHWAEECREVWDQVIEQNSDISPSRPENFAAFLSSYSKLPARLNVSPQTTVLDLGCGTGFISKSFSGKTKHVTGLDISPRSIELAQHRNPGGTYLVGDMAQVPLPDHSFDLIAGITSLEWCQNKRQALQETLRLLKPQGEVYFEVRNADFIPLSLPKSVKVFFEKIGWLKPLPMTGFRDFRHQEWKELFTESGFEVSAEYPSLRPWNYGKFTTRLKQSVIAIVRVLLPIRFHYMIGYRLRKKIS